MQTQVGSDSCFPWTSSDPACSCTPESRCPSRLQRQRQIGWIVAIVCSMRASSRLRVQWKCRVLHFDGHAAERRASKDARGDFPTRMKECTIGRF